MRSSNPPGLLIWQMASGGGTDSLFHLESSRLVNEGYPWLASFFMDRKTSATPESAAIASSGTAPRKPARLPMLVVYDQTQDCPYRDGLTARMPLEHPVTRIRPNDLDELLAFGYRRTGPFFYRTSCPTCDACIPVRVNVNEFRPSASMRRILNRSDKELDVSWGQPLLNEERLTLFNRHRLERGLTERGPSTLADYHEFLVSTSVETWEIAFRREGELIGIAITDVATDSLNAVYTYFDPDHARYSIGTLAILSQFRRALETRRRYVYLGLYVADNSHLNYKDRFVPQERRLDGEWVRIEAK